MNLIQTQKAILKHTLEILEEEPELEEAVISVNAEIRTMVPKGNAVAMRQIQQEMLSCFEEKGEVLKMEFRQGPRLLLSEKKRPSSVRF